jgi:hypothetical protein
MTLTFQFLDVYFYKTVVCHWLLDNMQMPLELLNQIVNIIKNNAPLMSKVRLQSLKNLINFKQGNIFLKDINHDNLFLSIIHKCNIYIV